MGHIAVGRPARRGGARRGERGQDRVWAFLRAYMLAHPGKAPSVREIAQGARLRSTGHAQWTLAALEREGLIRRGQFGRARAIEIVGAQYVLSEPNGGGDEQTHLP